MESWLEYSTTIQGWMTEDELHWLHDQARTRQCILEIGVWKGRSTSALAAGTPGIVYAVDHWNGALNENHNYAEAISDRAGVMRQAKENLARFGSKVRIQSECSYDAAHWFENIVREPIDMLFIDGAHDYESVKLDIQTWLPLMAKDGLISGHDFNHYPVRMAVQEAFGGRAVNAAGKIWMVANG